MELFSAVLFLICLISTTEGIITNFLPSTWHDMCTAQVDPHILGVYVENSTTENHVIHVQCHVKEEAGDVWRFQTLREQLREVSDVFLFLQGRCTNGKISLPWPMKANGLIGLVVSNCILTGKYADFETTVISEIPDQLRVLEIRNSVWLSDGSGFEKITSPEGLARLTADYDCGQDSTIEYLVTSNVSDLLVSSTGTLTQTSSSKNQHFLDQNLMKDSSSSDPETLPGNQINRDTNINFDLTLNKEISILTDLISLDLVNNTAFDNNATKIAEDEFLTLLSTLQSLNLKCHYEKLKLIDESYPRVFPIHHFQLMVQGARYPELRIMNYSKSGIRNFPVELYNFRMHFPKLEYLDLSRNMLTEIRLPMSSRGIRTSYLTLDVRDNLIVNISLHDVISWSEIEDVFVDIRDNPIFCGCQQQQLQRAIQSDTFFTGNRQKYSYIRGLVCWRPSQFKGQKLSQVSLLCENDNKTSPKPPSHTTITSEKIIIIICCSTAAAAILIATLSAVTCVRRRSSLEIFHKWRSDGASDGVAVSVKNIETGIDCSKEKT